MIKAMLSALLDIAEFENELARIENWWLAHALDRGRGGVHGEIADDNSVRKDADKGVILHTRALWFFSEVARATSSTEAQAAACALYEFIVERFTDADLGGLVWSLTADGAWKEDRKQVYAQAFAVYAFAAYARATDSSEALERAIDLAALIDGQAWDAERGGYVEAFARDWSPIDDVRLSERDLNAPKTMNTHLHVLEAATGLHLAAGLKDTARFLMRNIDIFSERFIAPRGDHLSLFYSMDWRDLCGDESYGHDIEASWLLWEAAETLGDEKRLAGAKRHALALAGSTFGKAISPDGGIAFERHADARGLVGERHWWPQTEAIVGFYNAFELSGEERFAEGAGAVWAFVKTNHIDRRHGEWTWLSAQDAPKRGPYKAGFWKGPYHNGRAMMEMMKRLSS
ncbi:MAG: AGE family epimerase/isomerase [Amphiplicatus sp.]